VGNLFPVGVTTITYTVTDSLGNTATAIQSITVVDNTPPTITGPPAIIITVDPNSCVATNVVLGSPTTSVNCSVASVTNDAPASFPIGNTTVTWTVTDTAGQTATATQFVTVVDRQNPTINAPGNISVRTGAGATSCAAFVSDADLGMATASYTCSAISISRDGVPAGNLFPVGNTTITYIATDSSGNTVSATQTVTVVDNTAPLLSTIRIDKPSLWPPNHQWEGVTLNYAASDNCVATCVLTASSSEPDSGLGDGDVPNDIVVVDLTHILLRAERSGRGTGRIYTLTVICTDAAGNRTTKTATVMVPHDMRSPKSSP
jgi:hypothetical protein